jgi:hypothetical protein
MTRRRALPSLRLLLAAAALTVLGLCAGAAMPGSASADDDDDGDNGGGTFQICSGSTAGSGTSGGVTTQICTITPAHGTNETCYQRSDEPIVVQRCTFTQTSGMSNLRLTATQIHDPEGGPSGTQDATQVIEGTQNNTGTISGRNSNYLNATQIAAQCLGHGDPFEDDDGDWSDEDDDGDFDDDGRCEDGDEEDGDDEEDDEDDNRLRLFLPTSLPASIDQEQEAHQTIDALQDAVNGRDEAYAYQTQDLHERAANATLINQEQNHVPGDNECGEFSGLADPLQANACFAIKQDSNGAKIAKLQQTYELFQSARNTTGGFQDQGDDAENLGGLEHSFDQTGGTGTPTQVSNQNELLTQRRSNTPGMNWHQFAGPRKDVGLQDDPNGRANMTQDVKMSSTGPGFGTQGAFLEIQCSSILGNCTGTQRAETNGESYFDMDSGPFIFMVARCQDFEEGTECFDVSD